MKSDPLYEGDLYLPSSASPLRVQVLLYPHRLVIHGKKEDGSAHTEAWAMATLKREATSSKDTAILHDGENGGKKLVIKSEEFAKRCSPPVSAGAKMMHRFKVGGGMIVASILLFLAIILLGISFVLFPWLVQKAAQFVPQEYEVKMGEEMYKSFIRSQQIDTAKTRLAEEFLRQIDFKTSYPLHVTVVASPVKNAFAMPGGHIVVFLQLLKEISSKEELAALLGHEGAHVTLRHSTKHIFKSLSTYLLVSALFGDMSGLSAILVQQAGQLNQLSYSRELEKEADETGLETLVSNHIDPQGMLDLFNTLQKGSEKGDEVPEFLSTHPMTENRVEAIKEKISEIKSEPKENPQLTRLFLEIKK